TATQVRLDGINIDAIELNGLAVQCHLYAVSPSLGNGCDIVEPASQLIAGDGEPTLTDPKVLPLPVGDDVGLILLRQVRLQPDTVHLAAENFGHLIGDL